MALILTDQEKREFCDYLVEYRSAHPEHALNQAIRYAREKFPVDRRIGATISGWQQLSWLKKEYTKAEARAKEKEKDRAAQKQKEQIARGVDSRAKLPVPQANQEQEDEGKKTRGYSKRVFLKDEEKKQFAEMVILIREDQPGAGWPQILQKANEYLPPHRRFERKFTTPSQLPWLPPLLTEVSRDLNQLRAKNAAAIQEEETPAPTPAPQVQPVQPQENFEDTLIDLLIGGLRPQIQQISQSEKFKTRLAASLGAPVPEPQAAPEPIKKKKILIVGLLPALQHEVERKWSDVYDLKMFDSNVGADQLKANLAFADTAIVMTRFLSHSTVNAARAHPGFKFCNGTISAVHRMLEEMQMAESAHH